MTQHLLMLFVLMLLAPTPALAYVDPGTGTLLVQGLIAAIAGAMVFFRGRWLDIKRFLRKLRGKDPDDRAGQA